MSNVERLPGSVEPVIARTEVGTRRELRLGGIRFTGSRRRPSGEREPLPHQLDRSAWLWLLVAIQVGVVWAVLFTFPATADWWTRVDNQILGWVEQRRTGALTGIADAVAYLGSDWVLRPLRAATLIALVGLRRWRSFFVAAGAFLGVAILTNTISVNVARPRPLVEIIGAWEGYAHPSLPVGALAVSLAVVGLALIPHGRWRARWMIGAAGVVALLSAARMYLGVDHPSDVLVAALAAPAAAIILFRWFVPESHFPVSYTRGKPAHLDIGGARGEAIRRALRDQMGIEVLAMEPFGLEASGGSTPIRFTVAGDADTQYLFGKLYTRRHLRSDRWYKLGRTLLYGSLEDEVRYLSVRRLVEHEDYLLRLMRDAGVPTAEPVGFAEITSEREYVIVTEFIAGAVELGEAEVTEDLVDQALLLIRRMWDAGLAHRDIKPANVMCAGDGRVVAIDVAFGTVRPTPWRQAVDLANMMLALALRHDPEAVYHRALRLFSPHDIAEAFAATRGITVPSQTRAMLKAYRRRTDVDLIALFGRLSPECEPIRIQRWGLKRVGLAIGSLIAVLMLISLIQDNLVGRGFL